MMNRTQFPLEAETEADRLRFTVSELQADLQRHRLMLRRLQGEIAASHLEVAGARGETVQWQGMLRQAEADAAIVYPSRIAPLEAEIASLTSEITELRAIIADREVANVALRADVDLIRASLSWRISTPVRIVGRLARRLTGRQWRLARPLPTLRVSLPATPEVAPPPVVASIAPAMPTDPNARYAFQVAPPSDNEAGILTLDALYHLSRSL
jgi:hypothetical protein